ncbi:MAG: 50S ribosomal protein L5 [Candidatus Aenigmatarchaeota archaeon]
MNRMQEIRLEKVTLNMGCAGDKVKIEKAEKFLNILTNQKPKITLSPKRSTFGLAKGKPTGVKVTLRGKRAEKILQDTLKAVDYKLKKNQINDGNFSFGIKESIDLPNIKYDPEIGIVGFDVCVTLERPGYRVKRRREESKIGKKHLITKEQTIEWLKKMGVEFND